MNFGGFVPISTVDWRGRAVCTVFFRGCPVRCSYCHNRSIQEGEDYRDIAAVQEMIRSSKLLVSGVVFSGGEPTLQPEPLAALMASSREMGLAVGLQTNGIFPKVLRRLVEGHLVDRIALDVKARWERYDSLLKEKYTHAVQESLAFCQEAVAAGTLAECEVVVTLFRGYEDEVPHIARAAGKLDLVLQQGVEGMVPPLSAPELKKVGERLKRPLKVRTREEGEVLHCG